MSYFEELLGMKAAYEQNQTKEFSLVTGMVKENWNEERPGMVKAEYLLGEEGKKVADWIRVMAPYAGSGYGYYSLPEIGTEVVIGFLMGDSSSAFVMGCLWNSDHKVPPDTADKDNSVKLWKTKSGHQISCSGEEGKEKLAIRTPGGQKIELDDENQMIVIADQSGGTTIMVDGKKDAISLKNGKNLELLCGSAKITMDGSANKIMLEAGQISISGKQSLELEAQSLKAEGAMTEIKAKGSMTLEASGIAQVKGSMLKLN